MQGSLQPGERPGADSRESTSEERAEVLADGVRGIKWRWNVYILYCLQRSSCGLDDMVYHELKHDFIDV